MRLKKLKELIYCSHSHNNIPQASVEVEFAKIIDTENDVESIFDNEFNIRIKRTINQRNESFYYLNDKKTTFKKISDLLRSLDIDLVKNRFMILQGEVE